MAKIIVVDDDELQRNLLTSNLAREGHIVTAVAESGSLYRELLATENDIVVLDVGLPGMNGFAIAQQLRAVSRTRNLGIIMVTGHGETRERIAGISSGADVYLTKPIDYRELNAYINNLYQRVAGNNEPRSQHGWRYIERNHLLTAPSGVEIPLTHRESMLVGILARNNGKPVRRKDIIMQGFKEDPLYFDERRLETMVSRLRKKLKFGSATAQPIKSAHGYGYMFSDEITVI